MRVVLPAILALLMLGCGEDQPRGVEVTEAADDARLPTRPGGLAFDTVYADSGRFVDPRTDRRLDSLRADSLRRDSLQRVRTASEPAPSTSVPEADFLAFWPRFQAAVRAGADAAAALTRFSPDLPRDDFGPTFEMAFGEPFRTRILALTPRDFRRDGTAREAIVTVGYDGEGEVVPQDEAETESAVILRFDVVDGAYRLVSVVLAG